MHLGLLLLTAAPSSVVLVDGSEWAGWEVPTSVLGNSSDPLQGTDRGEFLTPGSPTPTPGGEEGVGYRGSSPKKRFSLDAEGGDRECRQAGRNV